ncbi:recombination protein NinB [Pseudomonas sp. SM4]|jgi:hypothetical protein|uniref:recombination protein NinB n=1 Tax=Pseudomonas sp. SM4 TaxID=3424177 RepID=UPI003F78FF19
MNPEYTLRDQRDINRLAGVLHAIDLSKPKVVVIRDEKRPDVCNRKMWAMLKDVSEQVIWHGKKLTSEDWKCLFSASLEKQRAELASTVASW